MHATFFWCWWLPLFLLTVSLMWSPALKTQFLMVNVVSLADFPPSTLTAVSVHKEPSYPLPPHQCRSWKPISNFKSKTDWLILVLLLPLSISTSIFGFLSLRAYPILLVFCVPIGKYENYVNFFLIFILVCKLSTLAFLKYYVSTLLDIGRLLLSKYL